MSVIVGRGIFVGMSVGMKVGRAVGVGEAVKFVQEASRAKTKTENAIREAMSLEVGRIVQFYRIEGGRLTRAWIESFPEKGDQEEESGGEDDGRTRDDIEIITEIQADDG